MKLSLVIFDGGEYDMGKSRVEYKAGKCDKRRVNEERRRMHDKYFT